MVKTQINKLEEERNNEREKNKKELKKLLLNTNFMESLDLAPFKFTTVQEEWLRALESGKFRQTRSALVTYAPTEKRYRHCCLGVACAVLPGADREFDTEDYWVNVSGEEDIVKTYKYVNVIGQDVVYSSMYLSKKVADKYGLWGEKGQLKYIPQSILKQYYDVMGRSVELSEYTIDGVYISLAGLNDDLKFSFKEIAKFIRMNPYNVFKPM